MQRLYIVLTGLPARGKSIVGLRLKEGLEADGLKVRIFNNGDLRRENLGPESALPEFYNPENEEGRTQRDDLARRNMALAREFLAEGGQVAIMDATNASRGRRETLAAELCGAPMLYVECHNNDADLLTASIKRKARLPEFAELNEAEAVECFEQRIRYYERIYTTLDENSQSFVRVDSLHGRLLQENLLHNIPFYVQIRDILVSDWVRNLYLARHGESEFNVQGRIGGDSPLTARGMAQARALADHFKGKPVPCIFTSTRLRSHQMAEPLKATLPGCSVVPLPELDEIDAGVCDSMLYSEIKDKMPREYAARAKDKYNYVYPGGEGYATLRDRVERGVRKAFFLSGALPGIIIIGHQAINRMILSLFLFRREEDVPHIYIPQNEYFHIIATHRKKLLELVRFMD